MLKGHKWPLIRIFLKCCDLAGKSITKAGKSLPDKSAFLRSCFCLCNILQNWKTADSHSLKNIGPDSGLMINPISPEGFPQGDLP